MILILHYNKLNYAAIVKDGGGGGGGGGGYGAADP